jgi:YCII-related domain-containing protein
MTNYVIAYRGGRKFSTREEGAVYMARWQTWIGGLGDSMVDPGAPLGAGKQLSAAGISDRGADLLTGYSIVTAESLEAALELAKKCPHLDHGTVEVAEVMEMTMR